MDFSPIKTPRPDVTVGLSEQELYEQLHRHEPQLDPAEARDRLGYLQQMLMRQEPGGQQEPLLCSEPTRSSTGVRFPFLVVEGKSNTLLPHHLKCTVHACSKTFLRSQKFFFVRSLVTETRVVRFKLNQLISHQLHNKAQKAEAQIPLRLCTQCDRFALSNILWSHLLTLEHLLETGHRTFVFVLMRQVRGSWFGLACSACI